MNTGALSHYGVGSTVVVGSNAMLTVSAGTSWTSANLDTFLNNNRTGFLPGSALGIDTTNMNFSYTALTGSMGLTTVGSNNLTLSGNNSYYGVTTVNAGMLVVTNTGALPSFSNTTVLTVNNGER